MGGWGSWPHPPLRKRTVGARGSLDSKIVRAPNMALSSLCHQGFRRRANGTGDPLEVYAPRFVGELTPGSLDPGIDRTSSCNQEMGFQVYGLQHTANDMDRTATEMPGDAGGKGPMT